jgi:uncharacterized protein (TIGR02466 family)
MLRMLQENVEARMLTWTSDIGPAARAALIEAARKSIALTPQRVTDWIALGNLLLETGRFEEAADALSEATSRLPNEPKLHVLLASALQDAGRIDAALAAVEKALLLIPHDQAVLLRRFDLIVVSGNWDRVAGDLEDARQAEPARPSVIAACAHLARSQGDPAKLLAACKAALAKQPSNTSALHYKAIALLMLGRTAEARHVMGLDDFIGISDLSERSDDSNHESFLELLAAEILNNPTLETDPRGKATRHGLQTRVLVQEGDKALPRLLEQIKSAIGHYVEHLPASPHPFAAVSPARVRLNSWAVVYPQHGRQAPHFHPAGWISGVAYVGAPRSAGESKYRGPLVLGEVQPEWFRGDPAWKIHEVEPIPGRIVLFPSFVPHATRATEVPGQRISVAFDAVISAKPSVTG